MAKSYYLKFDTGGRTDDNLGEVIELFVPPNPADLDLNVARRVLIDVLGRDRGLNVFFQLMELTDEDYKIGLIECDESWSSYTVGYSLRPESHFDAYTIPLLPADVDKLVDGLKRDEPTTEPVPAYGDEYADVVDSQEPELSVREIIYKAIDGEREYQEKQWGINGVRRDPSKAGKHTQFYINDDGQLTPGHDVGQWMIFMQHYMRQAGAKLSTTNGPEAALHELRKVAALAVACFEQHGCPERV